MTPRLLHPFASPSRADFKAIVRGEGAVVFDDGGRSYVDALASLWYCNVGHGRKEIAAAVATQMAQLACFHTFEKFTNRPAERLAERLAELAPTGVGSRVFLTSSGSEAVDAAIKFAFASHHLAGVRGRRVIIARHSAYHGVTYGGMSTGGIALNRIGFGQLLPGIVHVDRDDVEAVERVFEEHPNEVAAVIAEPVQGSGGVFPPAPGYLKSLSQLCHVHGAWLILDEVITGFGRLGAWWGSSVYDVTPDLVTFAKGVSSGYIPLGGVVIGPRVVEILESDAAYILRSGHTYSGHPVACVAGLEAMRITEHEELFAAAVEVGEQMRAGLESLNEEGIVVDVRGAGAMWGVDIERGLSHVDVCDRMMETGVIARPIGERTIAFCPPLVITESQVDRCVESLQKAVLGAREDSTTSRRGFGLAY